MRFTPFSAFALVLALAGLAFADTLTFTVSPTSSTTVDVGMPITFEVSIRSDNPSGTTVVGEDFLLTAGPGNGTAGRFTNPETVLPGTVLDLALPGVMAATRFNLNSVLYPATASQAYARFTLATNTATPGMYGMNFSNLAVLEAFSNPVSTVGVNASYTITAAQPRTFTWTGSPGQTWNASDARWSSIRGPVWLNRTATPDIAAFNNAGSLNVASGINVQRIEFTGTTALTGGSLNFLAYGATAPAIDTAVGAEATIGSPFNGSAGFGKTGEGTLTLLGASTFGRPGSFTPGVTVSGGRLIVGDGVNPASLTGFTDNNFRVRSDGARALTIDGGVAEVRPEATITGGRGTPLIVAGTGTSAPAVVLRGGTLVNAGVVRGGEGSDFYYSDAARGADGVYVENAALVENSGSIIGGKGGDADLEDGGNGADGVVFQAGGTLINRGTISGGAAGSGGSIGSPGGPGIGVRFNGPANLSNLRGGVINGLSLANTANEITLEIGSTVNGDLGLGTNPASTLTLSDDGTGGSQSISTAVTGALNFSGALAKQGPGTWVLDRALTHSGGTTINGGTLRLAHANALGSGALTILGSTIDYADGVDIANPIDLQNDVTLRVTTGGATQSGAISETGGSFGITKTGGGTLLLAGNNTFTGGTTVFGGTLAVDGFQDLNRLAPNSLVTVNDGATFEIRGVNALPTTGNSVDVTANTGGTLRIVSGASPLTTVSHAHLRDLTLDGGRVLLDYSGSGVAYDSSSLKLNGDVTSSGNSTIAFGTANASTGGIGLAGARTFNVSSGTLTVSAEIQNDVDSAPGVLNKTGPGTLVLTGANTFSGGVSTSDFGTLAINSDAALGAAAHAVRFDNGVLRTDAPMTIGRDFNIDSGRVGFLHTNGHDVTVTGRIDGQAGFIKQGGGTLTLTNTGNSQWNNRIDAGTLAITDDRQLGLANGTLFLNGGNLLLGADTNLNRPIQLSAASTIDASDATVGLNQAISGTGPLTLAARYGRITLNAPITSTDGIVFQSTEVLGPTTFPTLVVGDGGSLPSGSLQISTVDTSAPRLVFDRSQPLIVPTNMSIAGSGRNTELTVRGAGPITLTGNSVLDLDSWVFVNGGGTLIVNGSLQARQIDLYTRESDPGLIGFSTIGGTGSITVSSIAFLGATSNQGNNGRGFLRGDSGSGTGTLTINGSLLIFGGNRGGIAVQLATDALGNIVDQSNLQQNGGLFRLSSAFGALDVHILNDASLQAGRSYTVDLITNSTGQFFRNGEFQVVSSYFASEFNLFGDSGQWAYTNVTPILANNTLSLSFEVIPIPEPAAFALLAAAVVLLVSLRQRRHR